MKKNPSDLPKSFHKDWKLMITSYEEKKYDKSIKSADTILKKNPTHIDTICVKALSKMQLNQKQEALDLIKNTLKTNLKSAKCWRTLGQIHIYDNQFEQASSALKTALKMDPKAVEVMKELCEVQIYLRDYPGYYETKSNIFFENSTVVSNWMGYAASAYMNGDSELALKILTTYLDNNMLVNKSLKPFSKNRLVCFKLRLLEETGRQQEIPAFLKKYEIFVTDKVYINELLYRVYQKLGQIEKSKEAITYLLERNTEKHEYHTQYLKSINLLNEEGVALEENIPNILQVYKDLKKKFPRSFSISRFPLTYARGEQFKQLFTEFIQPNLVKGVPSLFNSLKQLYTDNEKANIITQIITQILDSVQNNNTFPGEEEKLPITTILWVWIYTARHYDMLKDYKKAFEFIDKAIEHTPTLEDLYFIKAKFAKHCGDFQTAHRLVDKAKSIDIGDRFMNTKATIYAFRAGNFEDAERTANHFAKEQGVSNLNHMQAHWYFKEAGLCFLNKKDYKKALENFKIAMKHYNEYRGDEYDFHQFNHRMCSLSSEIEMVKSVDGYFKHPDYFISATKSLEIYLLLTDQKSQEKEKPTENIVDDPFAEAVKLAKDLEKTNPHRVETHLLAFQVNMRRKKFLLALKSLKSSFSISPDHPQVHLNKIQYFSQVYSNNLNETLVKVIKKESEEKSGLSGHSPQQYLDQLPSNTTAERLCIARGLVILDKTANLNRISQLFVSNENPSCLSSSVSSYELLVELGLNEAAEKFKTICSNSFPFSTFFGNQKIAMVQEDIHDHAYDEVLNSKENKKEENTEENPQENKTSEEEKKVEENNEKK